MRVSVLDFARIPSSPQRVTSWGVGEEEENRQRPHRWLPIRWRHRPTQPLQIPQPFRPTSSVPPSTQRHRHRPMFPYHRRRHWYFYHVDICQCRSRRR